MATGFGTAPHRIGGVWYTENGRRLSTGGQKYWERHYRTGAADGRGHVNRKVGRATDTAQYGKTAAVRKAAGQEAGGGGHTGGIGGFVKHVAQGAAGAVAKEAKAVGAGFDPWKQHGDGGTHVAKQATPAQKATGRLLEDVGKTTLGTNVVKAAQGKKVGALALGADAAMALPLVGSGGKALRAIHEAEDAARAAKGLSAAERAANRAKTRTLVVGRKAVQMPSQTNSPVTRPLERAFDRFSQKHPHMPVAGVNKRAFTQAGRTEAENVRRQTAIIDEAHHRALGHEGTGEDIAHFWWAQVPKKERTIGLLHEVRAKYQANLDKLVSEEELAKHRGKLQVADRPARIRDLGTSIAQLDKAIKANPKVNRDMLKAVAVYSHERKRSMIGSAILDAKKARDREHLTMRWLRGAEYVPHTPGRLGAKTKRQIFHDAYTAKLQGKFDRELAKGAKAADKKANTFIPRTRQEAIDHLAVIEAEHEKLIKAAIKQRKGSGIHAQEDVNRRVRDRKAWDRLQGKRSGGQREMGSGGGTVGPKPKLLSEEFRQETIDTLDRQAAAHSHEQWAQAYMKQRDEISHLNQAINDTTPGLGEGGTVLPAAVGHTRHLRPGTQLYHVSYSPKDIIKDGFRASDKGEIGPGVYLSPSPDLMAKHYPERTMLTTRTNRDLRLLDRDTPEGLKLYRKLELDNNIEKGGPAGFQKKLKDAGFDGVVHTSPSEPVPEVAIHDPRALGGTGEHRAVDWGKKSKYRVGSYSKFNPTVTLYGGALSHAKDYARQLEAQRLAKIEQTGIVGGADVGRGHYIRHADHTPPIHQRMFSPGTGKPKLPAGAGQENTMGRLNSGRLRMSVHQAREDFLASQTFVASNRVRRVLHQMGEKTPKGHAFIPDHPVEGYRLINPDAAGYPRGWKSNLLEHAQTDEELTKAANDIVQHVATNNKDAWKAIMDEAKATGVSDRLRVVREQDLQDFYAQLLPAPKAKGLLKGYDRATDAVVASIIIGRVGFIPKQMAQNIILMVPQMRARVFPNMAKAISLSPLNPKRTEQDKLLFRLLWSEVSGGAGGAISAEAAGKPLRYLGKKSTEIGDEVFRVGAMAHALANLGHASKYGMRFSAHEKEHLISMLTHTGGKRNLDLNRAMQAARDMGGDFNRLSPSQRQLWRRLVMVPNWLVAGTRLPAKLAMNRPLTTAAIGYVAAGEPGADKLGLPQNKRVDKYLSKNAPPWAQAIGGPGTKSVPIQSLLPASIPADVAMKAIKGQVPLPGDYSQAMIQPAWDIAHSQASGSHGTFHTSLGDSLRRNITRVVPSAKLIQDEISPPSDPTTYAGDSSRWSRLGREFPGYPVQYGPNRTSSADSAKSSARKLGVKLTDAQTTALTREQEYTSKRRKATKGKQSGTRDYYVAQYKADLDMAEKWGYVTPEARKQMEAKLAHAPVDDVRGAISDWSSFFSEKFAPGKVTKARLKAMGGYKDALDKARKAGMVSGADAATMLKKAQTADPADIEQAQHDWEDALAQRG